MTTTVHKIPSLNGRHSQTVLPERWESKTADLKVQELASFRLTRLKAEVLAPRLRATPAIPRLQSVVSAYVQLAITDPGIMTLLVPTPAEPLQTSATNETIENFLSVLREDLSEAIGSQKRTPVIDPAVAVQSLLGIIHWGVNCHRAEGRLSSNEAAAQITSLALHGLISQPANAPQES